MLVPGEFLSAQGLQEQGRLLDSLVQEMQYNSVKTPHSASPYPWFVFLCLLISFSPSMIH